jgi:hypothetical protein
MKRMLVWMAVLGLAGCATHAPRPSEIREAPTDRVFAFHGAAAGDATLVVTRDMGFAGSGCYMGVFVDGKEAAKLGTGERVTLHVPAGHHVLGTWQSGKALCSYRNGKDRRETDASVASNETRKFRILLDASSLQIEPTSL